MPLNCPIRLIPFSALDACEDCRLYNNEQCYWFFPSKPITEILTDAERIERLERQPRKEIIPTGQRLYKELRQLKGQVIFISNRINKHIDRPKRKGHLLK